MKGADNVTLRSRVYPVQNDELPLPLPLPWPPSGDSGGVLRALVFYEDPDYLNILVGMLEDCRYQVTRCSSFDSALRMLMQNRDGFDIFLSNAVVYGVDGFKLLGGVSMAMDIPLIVMSIEDHAPATIRCVFHGFCDCLFSRNMKEVFKDLWWRFRRRRKCKSEDPAHTGDSGNGGNRPRQEAFENSDIASFESEEKLKEEKEATTRLLKKPRVAWEPPLHRRFVSAVDQLGGEKKAFPKRILEIMDIPGLTRDNVASHLQKYRDQVRREKNAKESREKSLVPKSITGNVHEHPMNEIWDINTRSWTQQYPTMNGNEWFPSMNMDVQMAPPHQPTEPVIAGNEGPLNFSNRVAEISTLPSPPPPLNFPMNEIRDINTRSWTQQYPTMNGNEWFPSMNMDVQMAQLHQTTEPVTAGNEGQLNFSDWVAEISKLPSPPPPLNFPMNEIRDINTRSWTQQYPTMNGNEWFPSMNMDVQMAQLHQPTEPVTAGNEGQLNFSDRVAEISTLPSPPPPLNFPVCPSSAIQLEKSSFDCNIWEMVNQDGDLASMPEGFLSWEYRSSTPA